MAVFEWKALNCGTKKPFSANYYRTSYLSYSYHTLNSGPLWGWRKRILTELRSASPPMAANGMPCPTLAFHRKGFAQLKRNRYRSSIPLPLLYSIHLESEQQKKPPSSSSNGKITPMNYLLVLVLHLLCMQGQLEILGCLLLCP